MHVGLNLLYLVPGETGGRETYARELVGALIELAPGLRLTAFVNEETVAAGGPPWPGVQAVRIPVHSRNRAAWAYGEQILLPRLAARARIDVLHSPANTSPTWGAFRRVVTLHDLLYRAFPEFLSLPMRLGTRLLVPLGARRAHRIITGSHAAGDEIVRLLHLDRRRIDVIPHGVGASSAATATSAVELRARYSLGDRPIVYVAALPLPHKNLERLVEAVALIPPEERPVLAVSGGAVDAHDGPAAVARRLGVADDVRVLGWLPAADRDGLYAAAACVVVPSLYEGFGLPVLEAMTRGAPVACSDIPVLREVAGSAAVAFDPYVPSDIARAVREVVSDRGLAERLGADGRERAAAFTWAASARRTLASYEAALRS